MLNTENLVYWKNSPESQLVLKKLNQEIQRTKDALTSGALLPSPSLEKEYCNLVGLLNGLKFIENLLKETEEDQYDE